MPGFYRPSRFLQSTVLAVAVAYAAGCTSQLTLSATAARPATTSAVRAVLAASAAGTLVTINEPASLPDAVKNATNLKVRVGTATVTVTRNPGGSYTFVIPASVATTPEVNGDLRVVFVMGDRDSQVVDLGTGSPVQFDTPPVAVSPGFIVQGLDVQLHANSSASADSYQFTWSYGTTAQGPFAPIPGQGKDVTWTPPQQGNYFIKVDAVDRQTQQSYSTTTSSAVVFVTDTKDVLTTEPPSGTVARGNALTLKFNKPNGLTGSNLSYAWSAGPSAQGPWSVITGSTDTVRWLPTANGSYFVKAEVSNKDTGKVNTFISPNAVVFVTEGTPIVTPSQASVERGDRVSLNLNIAEPGAGPFTWYYGVSGSTSAFTSSAWTLLPGNNTGKTASQIVDAAGSYNYRVDFPDANGNIQSFTTTNPVLSVHDGALPLITSVPINQVISSGSAVTLQLNARGTDEQNFHYTWYYSTNPTLGFTPMPVDYNYDNKKKTFTWRTQTQISIGGNTITNNVSPGSYFIKVDAATNNDTTIYSFTSSSPVVTILNSVNR